MKKILIWLAGLALLIAGCSATLNPKQQLKTTTATVQTQVQKEQAALKIIGDSVGAFPSTFEKAYQDHPDTDFRNDDGPVKKLLAKRAAAFKQLEAANTADLETQISQLNQYYSSLNQQIDVMTANLTTVSSQADSLAKAVKTMHDD